MYVRLSFDFLDKVWSTSHLARVLPRNQGSAVSSASSWDLRRSTYLFVVRYSRKYNLCGVLKERGGGVPY